jgi:hypothetical protein
MNGNGHQEESNGNGEVAQDDNPGAFSNFRICQETVQLLNKKGITHLFPIQYETFDYIYDGKDVLGRGMRCCTNVNELTSNSTYWNWKNIFICFTNCGKTQDRTRLYQFEARKTPNSFSHGTNKRTR